MPARRTAGPTTQIDHGEPQEPGTALVMAAEQRRALLQTQGAQITTEQQLPTIKVMAAGAGLFEFGEGGRTDRTFLGVVLNSHPQNVLWDKPYGESTQEEDGNMEGPACRSNNGRYGTPRAGFPHLGLRENHGHTHDTAPVEATGAERIECATCPYNQWKSKSLIDARGGNGKAVTNQKAIYLLPSGQETPSRLVLPPTSIRTFDKYLADLLNSGDPVQTVLTKFSQRIDTKGTLRWAVVEFTVERGLTNDEFNRVMEKRALYAAQITPEDEPAAQQATATVSGAEAPEGEVDDSSGEPIPF